MASEIPDLISNEIPELVDNQTDSTDTLPEIPDLIIAEDDQTRESETERDDEAVQRDDQTKYSDHVIRALDEKNEGYKRQKLAPVPLTILTGYIITSSYSVYISFVLYIYSFLV